ncbi:hypothetical protein [Sphingobacterium sp. FBM7-1]|uniref:hypothetical protein n=1 Tax=Sphingobacterium sp. FBM7-1 TaxID=2886688 RepID=UPI001D11C029|nr:hypothetical protein [Sphingobacterium sp. FBM7-1]MCC2600496.1 hypothetical protein [Sphingobacterium sp. FBM7-1]
MFEIRPNKNVWETWRTNPENEKLYNNLELYAESKKEQELILDKIKEQEQERSRNYKR